MSDASFRLGFSKSVQTNLTGEACSATPVTPCHMPVGVHDFNDPRNGQRWRLAVHEAGHAVIARRIGLVIRSVSIARSISEVQGDGGCDRRDYDGRCEFVAAPKALLTDGVPNELGRGVLIVQAMAGFEAEALICPSPAVKLWRSDISDLADVARYNRMGEPFDLTGLREAARELVLQSRAAVEAVAMELLRRGQMSGSELDVVMAGPLGETQ